MTFEAAVIRGERVIVSHDGRRVVTVAGADARRLIERLERCEGDGARQLLLAKATGNFKRGNER